MEEKNTLKQTGYNRVAAIKGERIPYIYYALYDDDIKPGDKVLVSGYSTGSALEVDHILSPEQCKQLFCEELIEEVICKVDMSAYIKRLELRAEEEENTRKLLELEKRMCEVSDEYNSLVSEYLKLLVRNKIVL